MELQVLQRFVVLLLRFFRDWNLILKKLTQSVSQLFRTEYKLWERLHYEMRRKIQF